MRVTGRQAGCLGLLLSWNRLAMPAPLSTQQRVGESTCPQQVQVAFRRFVRVLIRLSRTYSSFLWIFRCLRQHEWRTPQIKGRKSIAALALRIVPSSDLLPTWLRMLSAQNIRLVFSQILSTPAIVGFYISICASRVSPCDGVE